VRTWWCLQHGYAPWLAIDEAHSSMAYLKTLPVHELKGRPVVVSQMTGNASDVVIVRSSVDLGRNLGLRVVAEGIEDPTTRRPPQLAPAAAGGHA